jgi:hypothetical protein
MNEMKQAMREELKADLIDEAREWLTMKFPAEGFDFFEDLEDDEVWAAIQRNYWYLDNDAGAKWTSLPPGAKGNHRAFWSQARMRVAGGLDAFLLDAENDFPECRTFVRRR